MKLSDGEKIYSGNALRYSRALENRQRHSKVSVVSGTGGNTVGAWQMDFPGMSTIPNPLRKC